MKRLLQTGTSEEYLDILILFVRIAVAAMMLTHGWPKLLKLRVVGSRKYSADSLSTRH